MRNRFPPKRKFRALLIPDVDCFGSRYAGPSHKPDYPTAVAAASAGIKDAQLFFQQADDIKRIELIIIDDKREMVAGLSRMLRRPR